MKLARELSELEAKRVQTLILLGGVITTLAIWTKLEDPINLPKMFVLVLFSAVIIGLSFPIILNSIKCNSRWQKIALSLNILFLLGLLASTFATDVKYTAIFGEYHRNNGALSYFAMALLMAVGSLVFTVKSTSRYFIFFGFTGLLLSFYGILQGAGADPVGWKVDYNPFITTLGNPNFTSGLLGLAGIAILYLTINAKAPKFQVLYSIGLLANLYILWRSGSIQGVFGFAIGSAVLILVKLWLIKKRFGKIGLLFTAAVGTPVALAILNIGPLANKLYQGTLKNRFDYWTAAVGMFKDHPMFGIGIDRFGEYYREYAVQNQVVQGQITDNAHSLYLQLLATGGLALFVPYILIIIFVTYVGFKSLLSSQSNEKFRIGAVFGIWLATITINVVTIDNLGVGVWFWITGGVLIAISSTAEGSQRIASNNKVDTKGKNLKTVNPENFFPVNYIASFIIVIGMLLVTVPALSKSAALYNFKSNAGSYTTDTYVPALVSESRSANNDPQYLIQLANLALIQGAADQAFVMIEQINKLDSRSYYGNYFAAFALEALNKRSDAIKYRERLKVLDPWNNASLIELIKDYLSVGNRPSAQDTATLIKQNYPGSQSDIDAAALLVG